MEHISLSIKLLNIFFYYFFLYIKNDEKFEKNLIKEEKQEKKKGKKINKDAILIKRLLDKKNRPIDIAKKFNISKQKVNYLKKQK